MYDTPAISPAAYHNLESRLRPASARLDPRDPAFYDPKDEWEPDINDPDVQLAYERVRDDADESFEHVCEHKWDELWDAFVDETLRSAV